MKVVTEILQDLEILKRLLKHNANLKIRINYYLTNGKVIISLLYIHGIPGSSATTTVNGIDMASYRNRDSQMVNL